MKLAKLSLAAVVAAGSFSMANAAVSLEDAIKDVQVSGFLRYRLDGDRQKNKFDGTTTIKAHSNINKFRAQVVANMKLDEYFSANVGVRFDAWDANGYNFKTKLNEKEEEVRVYGKQSLNGSYGVGKNENNVVFRDLNLVYNNADAATKVIAGRQVVTTLYTNGVVGDGILALNSSVDNVTFAAFYFANLDDEDSSNNIANVKKPLYGVGVLTNFGVVNANLWAGQVKDVATVYGLDAKAGVEVADDTKVDIIAQVSQTAFDSKMKKSNTGDTSKDTKDSTNFNVNAGFDIGTFNAKVGYAMTGSKKGNSLVTLYDSGTFDTMGEILMDFDTTSGQNQFIYASIGTQIDEFSAAFEYVNLTNKVKDDNDKLKGNEYLVRLGYDYNKKLKFSGFYGFAETKYDKDKNQENKFRIEAKYSF